MFADHKSSVTTEENPEVSDFAIEVRKASVLWPSSESTEAKIKEKENGQSVHNGRIYKKTGGYFTSFYFIRKLKTDIPDFVLAACRKSPLLLHNLLLVVIMLG